MFRFGMHGLALAQPGPNGLWLVGLGWDPEERVADTEQGMRLQGT